MTQEAIKKQIDTIKKANEEARKTKESAREFLMEAGIIKKVGEENDKAYPHVEDSKNKKE